MRRHWICLRRLRPSIFTCFSLLISAAGLTLLTLLSDRSIIFRSIIAHSKSERYTQNIGGIYSQYISWKNSSSELFQKDHASNVIHDGENTTVQIDEVMNAPQEYSQNLQTYISRAVKAPSYSNRYETNKQNSSMTGQNFRNMSGILDAVNTFSVDQLSSVVSEFFNSHIDHWKIKEGQANSFTSYKEDLLKVLSHVLHPLDSFSIHYTLGKLMNGENITDIIKSQNVTALSQIIKYIKRTRMFNPSEATKDQQKNYEIIPSYDTSSMAKNVHQKTRNSDKDNHLLELQNDILNVTDSSTRPHVRVIHRKFHRKTLHRKSNNYQEFRNTNNNLSQRARKDATYTFTNIVNGIYWSDEVEERIPKGITIKTADEWMSRSRMMTFKSLQAATWNKCGRPKNGFALLMDNSEACVRYRAPNDRLLQGEIMSYWLARLLGLDNVPPVYLSSVDTNQWSTLQKRFQELGWAQGNYVATIMWIDEIDSRPETQALMPRLILEAYRQKRPLDERMLDVLKFANDSSDSKDLKRLSSPTRSSHLLETVIALAQWGSMIIFDYLTGNYDRVASMQDGAEKEKNPSIIEESIRNLRKSKSDGKLWLIDNESGLLDAYHLMYLSRETGQKFVHFHDDMLYTSCIFQRGVVQGLQALHKLRKPHKVLEKYAEQQEPLLRFIEKDSSYELFEKQFSQRLKTVVNWIRYCEDRTKKRINDI